MGAHRAPLDALDNLQKNRFTADQVRRSRSTSPDEATIVNNRIPPDINISICRRHARQIVTFKSAHDVARMKDPACSSSAPRCSLSAMRTELMPKRVAVVE